MGYVLLGHGSIYVRPEENLEGSYKKGMGIVAIPPGTTLQCYSDAGQSLITARGLVELWPHLTAPWPPMTSDNVTYNLSLGAFEDDDVNAELERWKGLDTGGHKLLVAGRDEELRENELLCTGTTEDCPTDPRRKVAHNCDGILGRFAGRDLFWISCTAFDLPSKDEAKEIGLDLPVTEQVVAVARSIPDAIWGANPDDPIASAKTHIEGLGDIGEQSFAYSLIAPNAADWNVTQEQRALLMSDPYLKGIVKDHWEKHKAGYKAMGVSEPSY